MIYIQNINNFYTDIIILLDFLSAYIKNVPKKRKNFPKKRFPKKRKNVPKNVKNFPKKVKNFPTKNFPKKRKIVPKKINFFTKKLLICILIYTKYVQNKLIIYKI